MDENTPSAAAHDPQLPDDNGPSNPVQKNQFTPHSPSRRRRILGGAIAWILILTAVAVTQIPQYGDRQSEQPDIKQDSSLQLMGRYAVGMKNILGSSSAEELGISQLRTAIQNSDNPQSYLLFIPVLMELATREEALLELEHLIENPGNEIVARDAAHFQQMYQHGSDSLTEQQYSSIESYGWVGKLALSYDKAASDPSRQAVVNSATKTFIVAIVAVLGALAALAAGFILLILTIILWNKKQLRVRFAPPENPGVFLLEAFAIFITSLIAIPALVRLFLPGYEFVATLFTIPAVGISLFWPLLCGSKWSDVRTAVGLHRGEGIFREMGAGILGYLAGLPLLGLAFIPVMLLSRYTGTVPSHPITNEISLNPITLIIIFGLACIWAPVIEEAFFRGVLFGYLSRRLHWSIAGIVTGVLFAVIHPQGWIAVPLLATIGFTLSAIRQWRGSIIASMTAHALNNGAVLLLAVFMLT